MNHFMIGMYGKYDYKKFKRDFRKDFYGIEACLFEKEEDIGNLVKEAERNGFKYGIHFPLRAGKFKLRDPQFLSLNEETRRSAYKDIEEELDYIRGMHIKPEYILFHYPKPVVLKENFDMKNWRFADASEYCYETEYAQSEFEKNSEYLFQWLSEKSMEYNFTPVLELDALNKYVCESDLFERLLDTYKRVKVCLDIGRIHLQQKIDVEFNSIEIIKKFSKYTEVVHLWNVQVKENLGNNHYPALPKLRPEEGWAPIEEYLKIIKSEGKDIKIMFEHRSDLITDQELHSCYEWIRSILE